MRAVICNECGAPESLRVEERPSPQPGDGEVVIAVRACGVNYTDVLAVQGRSQMKIKPPFTPGVELAGVIARVGPGVTHLQPGQRVLATGYWGGYTEEYCCKTQDVLPIPDAMDFTQAAGFFIVANTSRYALIDRAKIRPGETLLVIGAGSGAGLTAVEIGKALGAHVVAAASSPEKLELAREHGADQLFRYPAGPLDQDGQIALCRELRALVQGSSVTALMHSPGYDVIYDGVGGTYAEPAVRALAWRGRYLSVGFAAGVPSISAGPLLFRNADFMGIELGEAANTAPGLCGGSALLLQWFREGKLRSAVSAVYPLEKAGEALCALRDRKARGKLVLVTGSG